VNVSEGRRPELVAALGAAAGDALLDVHVDADHHRSVLTLVGEQAPRALAEAAVAALDLREHTGVHPRFGVVDVVPFVPIRDASMAEAVAARDAFARWAATTLDLPCFLYGPPPDPSLPEVRREAFRARPPDVGPPTPHETAGACAVGARRPLLAYNVWLAVDDLPLARAIAAELRGPHVRALGLQVQGAVQVSMNLLEPTVVGPAEVVDAVAQRAPVARTELVGLAPSAVLDGCPASRWAELDLAPERTVEARLAARGW